jgi:hypothetical protein
MMSLHSDPVAHEIDDSAGVTVLRHRQGAYALTLQVVPLTKVVPHEHYHGPRVAELMARLVAEGKLINPPIVARQKDKYVVLDGATRLAALHQLGCPYIIVQVVELEQVQLTSWCHAIYGGSAAGLLEALRAIAGLQLTPFAESDLPDGELPVGALGYLVSTHQEGFVLEVPSSSLAGSHAWQDEWLRMLNRVVEVYGQWGNVERTLTRDIELLATQFPDLAALVIFPRFTPQVIMELADQGRTVPAGITRFVIPGRILRLNAPLDRLATDEPLAAKQEWLENLVRTKLLARQVRFYEESVVLFDE